MAPSAVFLGQSRRWDPNSGKALLTVAPGHLDLDLVR
jgi:hypothetical protein